MFQKIILQYIKKYSIPILGSFFKAYRSTTANAAGAKSNTSSGSSDNQKKHPFDQFFSSMMSKTNLSAPPIDEGTALQILNI